MRIKVDVNKVKIINSNDIHKGEYKLNLCEFEFTEEYKDLTKIAVFKRDYTIYKVDILDNKCHIPHEVLTHTGDLFIGVYAYISNNEELIKRYSPIADKINIKQGSYVTGGNTPTEINPSQYELYSQELNKGLLDIENAIKQLEEDKENGVFDGEYTDIKLSLDSTTGCLMAEIERGGNNG